MVSSRIIHLADDRATARLGQHFGLFLPQGTTLLLEGNLGAGKTTLVQGIAKGLGVNEVIVSPTFTIVNEYLEGRIPLYHLDLYRLSSAEIESVYPEIYWEGLEVIPGITAIEWAEKLPYQPDRYISIQLVRQACGRQAKMQIIGSAAELKDILPDEFA